MRWIMAQWNLQRTAEELKNSKFNYYIAFNIDLKESDKTKIEQKIKTELGKTTGTILQRRLNELKNDIFEVMLNDAVFDGVTYNPGCGARQKESDTAREFKLNEAVDFIQMLCKTRKTLFKSDLLDIYKTVNRSAVFFTEDEFFKKIDSLKLKDLGVKIINNTDIKIPFSKFQETDNLLEPLNKQNLYDYLGLTKTALQTEIEIAARKIYDDAQKTSDLKKKQSVSKLDGLIRALLFDQTKRKSYDQYIVIKKDVWDEFAKRKAMTIKEIEMPEYNEYTQRVIDLLKNSIQEAEEIIALGCKYFQLTIVGESGENSFELCPFEDCGKLNTKGAKSCIHCGRPLEVMCWNCNRITRITKEDKGCPICGATFQAHKNFNTYCQSMDLLLNKPTVEIIELQSALLKIKNVVPDYASRSDSTISKKIKEYDEIIAERVKQEETIGAKYKEEVLKIQQLKAKHYYQSALVVSKSLLTKYNSYNVKNSKKLVSDISAVMQTAIHHVDSAKQYLSKGNATLAISEAAKAIDICDDFTDARQIMQKYPPQPVTNLRIGIEKNKVRIEWDDDSKQEFTSYTIIKKIGIAPTTDEDGAVVDEGLSVRFFEDSVVVSATPYYYAVFAERYGVKSKISISTTPAIIYSDVINMRQEVVDNGVKVVWEAPQNVKSIEVWRNNGTVAPLYSGEGTSIDASNNGFDDRKCSGENAYLVICNYEIKGKIVRSNGVSAVFKPYEPISPLEDVNINFVEKNRYTFSCKPDYIGKVKLYYANTKLAMPFNSTLKYLDFNVVCKGLVALETSVNTNGEMIFSLPIGKIYQVYPIVSTEQLFVVSPPHLINTMEGISKCTHSVASDTVSIGCVPHPQAKAIIAKICNDRFIENIDGDGEKFTFNVDDLRKSGKIEIKLKTNTVNYITLFAEFKDGGVVSYSPAIKIYPPIDYREAVTVLYSMEYEVSPVKAFNVTISFEADNYIEIPKLLLMQGSPRPSNKNLGKLCERIEGIVLKKGLFSKKYTAKKVIKVNPASSGTKFVLFLDEESSRIDMKPI